MIDDVQLANFKLTAMLRILKNVDFKSDIQKINNIIWYHRYLWNIKLYHAEGKATYYVGGTWVNAGLTNI